MVKQFFGSIVCRFAGHQRGKRIAEQHDAKWVKVTLKCPRCGATWTNTKRAKCQPS